MKGVKVMKTVLGEAQANLQAACRRSCSVATLDDLHALHG